MAVFIKAYILIVYFYPFEAIESIKSNAGITRGLTLAVEWKQK